MNAGVTKCRTIRITDGQAKAFLSTLEALSTDLLRGVREARITGQTQEALSRAERLRHTRHLWGLVKDAA